MQISTVMNYKGREPPSTSKIWVGRGAHRNKSPRGNEVCERCEAKMERNGAKMERNGAKMERNGAKMERNGAKMERKWSETYRPSPLCGTGGMCAGKPFKKCLVTSRPMNLPVTNVTWLLPWPSATFRAEPCPPFRHLLQPSEPSRAMQPSVTFRNLPNHEHHRQTPKSTQQEMYVRSLNVKNKPPKKFFLFS